MPSLPILSATDRAAERGGVKGILLGKSGIGKTSQLWKLDTDSTLFVDLEAGDLAVSGWIGDTVRPRSWYDCRDIACWLAGPNPALADRYPYSQAHYDSTLDAYGDPAAADKYKTLFIDSITVASRICLDWAISEQARPDTRAAYGLMAREMLAWASHLQHARSKNVWMVCALDDTPDDMGRRQNRLHLEGRKTAADLPGVVDVIVTMLADNTGTRVFVCNPVNDWNVPAKDRSGGLEVIEQADLGSVTDKLLSYQKQAF